MFEIVYFNGSLIPRSQAKIPAMDYGFLYGLGIFETMRTYNGKVFRLDSHLSRLSHAASTLEIPIKGMELKGAVTALIQANELTDARVRITVSRGEGTMTPDPDSCQNPVVLITATPYQPPHDQIYNKGYRAAISSIRRNSQSPIPRLKTINYLENILARQEARKAGADEALFLNEKGLLAESSMSNIFLVAAGKLRTPGEDSGILSGITRATVLKLAAQMDIDATEGDIGEDEIYQAQEAFLTNSLIEIMPLTTVAGKPIGAGVPGDMTQRLRMAYREAVAKAE